MCFVGRCTANLDGAELNRVRKLLFCNNLYEVKCVVLLVFNRAYNMTNSYRIKLTGNISRECFLTNRDAKVGNCRCTLAYNISRIISRCKLFAVIIKLL